MKKWIFSTFILTMALGNQSLRAEPKEAFDTGPLYSADSRLSTEQQNQIFSIFSVYREEKDEEEVMKNIVGLGLKTMQISRLINELGSVATRSDSPENADHNFLLALTNLSDGESQVVILKSALERMQFMQLAKILKSYSDLRPGVRTLVQEGISKSWTVEQPNLHINIETLKRFASYIDTLPLAEQVVIQEGAINQLEYLMGEAINKRNHSQEQIGSNNFDMGLWSIVSTVGGVGWVRIFSKDSFFFSKKGLITSAILATVMGGSTFYLHGRKGETLATLLAADQKELDALQQYIAEERENLADLKEALEITGGEAPTDEPVETN